MEDVLIHSADLDNGKGKMENDSAKVEMTDTRRNIIRMGTYTFIAAVVICVFIILVRFK